MRQWIEPGGRRLVQKNRCKASGFRPAIHGGSGKASRYPQRDRTLILVVYRHGLRAIAACDLEWSQVDFKSATLHVRRVKNGKPATHPIRGDELRAHRKLCADQGPHIRNIFCRGLLFHQPQ
jgi:integrase